MNSKLTISVGLSALNEGKNIKRCLLSILNQTQRVFVLKEIIVISDGSTDNTISECKSINSKLIKIINHPKRMGQSRRLNEIYQLFKGDLLIQTDADVIFESKKSFETVAKAFSKDSNLMMCGGHLVPHVPTTITEKAIYTTYNVYTRIKQEINGGNNPYTITGPVLAYRSEFIKSITIPSRVSANDKYVYLSCKQQGLKYKFIPEFCARYRLPQTIVDQIKQNSRFRQSKKNLDKYFNKNFLKKEFYISRSIFYNSVLKELLSHPTLVIYIYLINLLAKLRSKIIKNNHLWETITTSKI